MLEGLSAWILKSHTVTLATRVQNEPEIWVTRFKQRREVSRGQQVIAERNRGTPWRSTPHAGSPHAGACLLRSLVQFHPALLSLNSIFQPTFFLVKFLYKYPAISLSLV